MPLNEGFLSPITSTDMDTFDSDVTCTHKNDRYRILVSATAHSPNEAGQYSH